MKRHPEVIALVLLTLCSMAAMHRTNSTSTPAGFQVSTRFREASQQRWLPCAAMIPKIPKVRVHFPGTM